MASNIESLKKYLATGETPTEDAALVVVGAVASDPFKEILGLLCATELLAKDFHYRAKGKTFYGEHQFADLVWEIGRLSDKLNEVYYMGELQQNPPFRRDVAMRAVEIVDGIPEYVNEDGYLNALYEVSNRTVSMVERARETKTLAGSTSVLDEISQEALKNVALLKRVLSGSEFGTKVDADSADGDSAVVA